MLSPLRRIPLTYAYRSFIQTSYGFHSSSYWANKPSQKTFKLADIGEGITECEVLKWSVQAPAKVQVFDLLCEVQSDKATVEITSPFDGIVSSILVPEGEIAKVGQGLCVIDVEDSSHDQILPTINHEQGHPIEDKPKSDPQLHASPDMSGGATFRPRKPHPLDPNHQQQSHPSTISESNHTLATPSVRHYARSKGIPLLSTVGPGSGKNGRIEKVDVDAWLANGPDTPSQLQHPPLANEDATVELGRTRWAMWKAMEKSLSIPHFGYSTILDLTALSEIMPILNAHIPSSFNPATLSNSPAVSPHSIFPTAPPPVESDPSTNFTRLTYLPLLLKTLARAMQEWPVFRSSPQVSQQEKPSLAIRPQSDIAIALSTPTGLYTPVLQSVEAKSPYEIMGELRRLQVLGRKVPNGLTPKDMPKRGATITVSNVGAIGKGEFAAPLLVPGGGVAIVAIGRAKWVQRDLGRRLEVGISWSADHRIIEGAEMAAFTETWRSWVEHPSRLIGEGR